MVDNGLKRRQRHCGPVCWAAAQGAVADPPSVIFTGIDGAMETGETVQSHLRLRKRELN